MHPEQPIRAPKLSQVLLLQCNIFIINALVKMYHVDLSIFSLVNFHNKLNIVLPSVTVSHGDLNNLIIHIIDINTSCSSCTFNTI